MYLYKFTLPSIHATPSYILFWAPDEASAIKRFNISALGRQGYAKVERLTTEAVEPNLVYNPKG